MLTTEKRGNEYAILQDKATVCVLSKKLSETDLKTLEEVINKTAVASVRAIHKQYANAAIAQI